MRGRRVQVLDVATVRVDSIEVKMRVCFVEVLDHRADAISELVLQPLQRALLPVAKTKLLPATHQSERRSGRLIKTNSLRKTRDGSSYSYDCRGAFGDSGF